jgi:hypothetical protein
MKLITAHELQNMDATDVQNFFNSISRREAQSEGERQYMTGVQRSFDRVIGKMDLYWDYCFD